MSEFLFNVAAVICSIVVTFWLLDRIEHAWHAISGQCAREAQLLDRYASSVYLSRSSIGMCCGGYALRESCRLCAEYAARSAR